RLSAGKISNREERSRRAEKSQPRWPALRSEAPELARHRLRASPFELPGPLRWEHHRKSIPPTLTEDTASAANSSSVRRGCHSRVARYSDARSKAAYSQNRQRR